MIRKVPNKLPKKIKLDIGCGEHKCDGFIGMDIRDCGQEILWDANQGIPLQNESVDEVFSSHFMEHLEDDATVDMLQEIMRVLKHKGKFVCRVPHSSHPTAFYVGHKSFWNEWKVDALQRLSEEVPPFTIEENRQDGLELKFTLVKV